MHDIVQSMHIFEIGAHRYRRRSALGSQGRYDRGVRETTAMPWPHFHRLPPGDQQYVLLRLRTAAATDHYKTDSSAGNMHEDGQQLHVMTEGACVYAALKSTRELPELAFQPSFDNPIDCL
jgi:hypothetical protein